jgi:hypothetical protein
MTLLITHASPINDLSRGPRGSSPSQADERLSAPRGIWLGAEADSDRGPRTAAIQVRLATSVIRKLGAGAVRYSVAQRVRIGAITPCGQREACLMGDRPQCRGPLGGWRLGNSIDGVQAEYAFDTQRPGKPGGDSRGALRRSGPVSHPSVSPMRPRAVRRYRGGVYRGTSRVVRNVRSAPDRIRVA